MNDELVTTNFWLSEFVSSDDAVRLGIDNTPGPDVLATLRNVLIPGMQSVRAILDRAVLVSSGYRCPALNRAVRGSATSQHMTGHACDFRSPDYGTPRLICRGLVLQMKRLRFDQLIFEGSWVHISFSPRPRNQVLTAHFSNGSVSYTTGLA